jgi:capsular polysaccharide biosynthesis protein
MDQEIGIFDLLRIIINNWVTIIFISVFCAAGTFFVSSKITPWYGYSALLRIPAFTPLNTEISKASLLGGGSSPKKDTKSEISNFLDYYYLKNPMITKDNTKTKYLKSVDLMDDTELVAIEGRGLSPDEAKAVTVEVAGVIQKLFENRVKAALIQRKQTLDFMEASIAKLNGQLEFVEKGLKLFGAQANLFAEKSAIQGKLIDAQKEKIFYESKTGDDVIHPLTVISEREVTFGGEPVFPKPKLFSAAAMLLGFFLSSIFFIFL